MSRYKVSGIQYFGLILITARKQFRGYAPVLIFNISILLLLTSRIYICQIFMRIIYKYMYTILYNISMPK